MKQITKVYQLNGMAAGKLKTTYCGNEITLNFRNGMGASGNECAVLITSERFIQDAIEADSRFGSLIRLDNVYANEVKARNEYQTNSVNIDPNEDTASLSLQKEEEARLASEEAKKQAIREKRARARAKASAKQEEIPAEKVTFADANEAMRFMIEKGEQVSDATLPALLEKYNAVIEAE